MKTTKNKYNISEEGFAFELYKFVKGYYNTGKEVLIYKDVNTLLYNGIITLSTQQAGTETQKQTYLNMQINNFINNLKKLNR
mgnify:CR=1 FL=1|tara:strand:+ start:75 stop:320 length:246 start_codon:yes stop_codon:yes gene_type:complete